MFPLNLPNALTLIRILLVPVLVVALTVETPGGSTIAAIVFAIAALTDGLDGYIARSRQSVTTFGKVMDPVADKLMIAAALISLVSLDRLAAWVAMVIIAREFAVSGLRIAAGQQGVVIPASGLGKVKTIVQVAAVLALIAANDPNEAWVQALVYLMVAITSRAGRTTSSTSGATLDEAARERRAARLSGSAARQRCEALDQLLAAGAAQVERAVEALVVDVEDREQDVRRAHVLGLARDRANCAGALGHVVEHVAGRGSGLPWPSEWSCSEPVMSGASPTPSACKIGPPGRAGAWRAASARPRPRLSGRMGWPCPQAPPPGPRPAREGYVRPLSRLPPACRRTRLPSAECQILDPPAGARS